jgi:hypothetical protein
MASPQSALEQLEHQETLLMGRLTHESIRHHVGEIDDERAARIIATGANEDELEEAVAWAAGMMQVGKTVSRPLSGVIAEIYDILTSEETFDDEVASRD